MLTLTPTAAEAVRALVAGGPVDSDTGGIRIAPGEQTAEGTPLQLAVVDAPEPADEQVDSGGAHVFVEPDVAGFLGDKVLDASVAETGQVQFALVDAGPESGSDGRVAG
jgi:Fe-S cluster assembly iron-binding protein IscA